MKNPNTGISIFLSGWQPESKGLLVTALDAQGSIVQTIDLESGAVAD